MLSNDNLLSKDGERVHHLIRHSVFYKTNGLGHMRILQNNKVVKQTTTFMCTDLLEQRIEKQKKQFLCEMSE